MKRHLRKEKIQRVKRQEESLEEVEGDLFVVKAREMEHEGDILKNKE